MINHKRNILKIWLRRKSLGDTKNRIKNSRKYHVRFRYEKIKGRYRNIHPKNRISHQIEIRI